VWIIVPYCEGERPGIGPILSTTPERIIASFLVVSSIIGTPVTAPGITRMGAAA
jgi:hypothetical protein